MKRLRTAFKWLAIVLGAVATLALLVVAMLNWRAGACLEEQLQAIRQAGEPLSLADLAREPVPPELNAVTFLRRAEKSIDAINQELSVLNQKRDDYYDDGRLNPRGMKLVESALAAYPEILPSIEEAAGAPDYVPDHDYTLSPEEFLDRFLKHVQRFRGFARCLQYRGDLLLARHERDESLRNGLTLLRLNRHFENEPMIIAYLISAAVRSIAVENISRALADGPIAAGLRDDLDAELARQPGAGAFGHALRTERVYGIESFHNFTYFMMWHFKQDECDYLKRLAEESRLGPAPRYKITKQLSQLKSQSAGGGVLTRLFVPTLEVLREADQRSRAKVQCLRVLNALTRYNDGYEKGPPRLEDLNLPAELTTDPYDGQPIKTKRTESGWTIYSVGSNLKDDGGKIEESEDVGVGPEG